MLCHITGDDIALGEQVSAAVMIDNAFRIACCARGIIKRNRIPFIIRSAAFKSLIARCNKVFIVHHPQAFTIALKLGIVIINDDGLHSAMGERLFHCF